MTLHWPRPRRPAQGRAAWPGGALQILKRPALVTPRRLSVGLAGGVRSGGSPQLGRGSFPGGAMYISPGLADRRLNKDCMLPGYPPSKMDHEKDWILAGRISAAQRPFPRPQSMPLAVRSTRV